MNYGMNYGLSMVDQGSLRIKDSTNWSQMLLKKIMCDRQREKNTQQWCRFLELISENTKVEQGSSLRFMQ